MDNSRLSPEEIRAAAEVHNELSPEYRDAVVASFLEKVDVEIAARIDARLAGVVVAGPHSVARPRTSAGSRRGLLQGLAIGFGAATVPLLWFWDQGTRGPGQHPVRALVLLACLAIAVTCGARGFIRRGRG
ncbi:MAG TPA: hypothetical protein VNW50_16975 [Streptosporangiaceae bacterium]|nr:hypothetical protein [Streptosporangiaceae bacterium]